LWGEKLEGLKKYELEWGFRESIFGTPVLNFILGANIYGLI
jgi:hypothetical protein